MGEFKEGEQYFISYDSKKQLIIVEGGRLKDKVEKKIKKDEYFPSIYMLSKDTKIEV